MSEQYRKKRLFRPNPEVSREIARLDARTDCQRIVYLLSTYEYSWDFSRALELALFYTYGSESISRLLDKTGEFREHGQKRYDDTRLLIAHIIQDGWERGEGARAIARMNKTHGHYRISQDDFIFTLWTFIDFPIRWASRWSARPMTAHEREAWFHFWLEVGRRMTIQGIPPTPAAYAAWIETYRQRTFIPAATSARVAAATIRIIENWWPKPMRGWIAPLVYSLFDDEPAFLDAVQAPLPPRILRVVIKALLKCRGWIRRYVVLGAYPQTELSQITRTYGRTPYEIDDLAPERIKRAEHETHR